MPLLYDSPRRLLVSWRAPQRRVGVRVHDWVKRFKDRASVELPASFEVIDTQAFTGGSRADPRDGSWTDFFVVWTVDYCVICRGEEGNELCKVMDWLQEPGLKHWVARLEEGDLETVHINGRMPWARLDRWRFIPESPKDPPLPTGPTTMDKAIAQHCIRVLRD